MENSLRQERLYVILLAAIQFIHMVDFVVMMPLGPTLMQDFKIGPTEFGTLVSSYNFSAALFGFCFAMIADRFGRKHSLLVALLGLALGTLTCSLANSFLTLLVARILTGVFGGILNALTFIIVTDLIPFKRRGKAMGAVMASFSLASVLGVPLGLTIADNYGWERTFMLIAVVAIILAAVSLRVFPALKDHVHKTNAAAAIKRFYRLIVFPAYARAYLYIFVMAGSMFLLIPFLAPYAVKNMGIMSHQLKYMYLVAGAVTALTAPLIGRLTDKWGTFPMFTALSLLSCIPIYILTNAGVVSLATYILISTFFMLLVSGRMIPAMTLISAVPEHSQRGSFMVLLNAVRSSGSALGTLLGGILITQNQMGQLQHFNSTGFLSMAISLVAIYLALKMYRQLSKTGL